MAIDTSIQQSTRGYEAWLGDQIPLIPADLRLKHQRMAEEPFAFLRATFYRWAQLWPEVCPGLAAAPAVLSVGDLHVENFGTWRDVEGRLIWGINDFDEAWPLPYTLDLVRLAASALLATSTGHLAIRAKDAATAVLKGYGDGVEAGGRPIVLAEEHPVLREMARFRLKNPSTFWSKLSTLPPLRQPLPAKVKKDLLEMLPQPATDGRFAHRIAGLGSLGRQRYVAVGTWRGGLVAREAKRLCTSACAWAEGKHKPGRILYADILQQAIRCPDPLVCHKKRWLLRRLAPDCSRIELASLPRERDERRLLHAMGFETANIHLGGGRTKAIAKDLRERGQGWLYNAAKDMVDATMKDWEAWRKAPRAER